jgi:carbon monoxide dehydrogenase subunit G
MIEFDTTVRIDRARERVFAILADFESNLARWAKGPVAATRTAGDGGAGTRYTITAKAGPAKVRSPYEVTGYDPPARFAGHGIAGPVRFSEEYTLTADGPATILTQSIQAAPRGPFRLAGKALRRQLQQLIAADLGRLKNLAEAEVPQDSAHPGATNTNRHPATPSAPSAAADP